MRHFLVFIFILFTFSIYSQSFFTSIFPHDTDTNITTGNIPHRVYFDKNTESNNRLFVFFSGTNALAEMYDEITITATKSGYHAISLAYPNTTSISQLCKTSFDLECSEKPRLISTKHLYT